MAFERGVGLEDAVGSGVVGVFIDGVRAYLLAGGWETEIDDADAGNQDFIQVTGFPFMDSERRLRFRLRASCCCPAAVDGEDGTVDELGFAGAEIADEGGDVFGRAEASDRLASYELGANLFFFLGVILVEVAFDKWGLDGAGSYAIDAELFGVVDGDLAGHGVDCAFAGAVGEALFDADQTSDGAEIDYGAVGSEDQRECGLGDEEDGVDIDTQDADEFLFGGVSDVADEADAGVVDKDIERGNSAEGARDGGRVGDVHLDGFCVGELGGKGLGGGEVEVRDEDVSSGAGEFAASCSADAAGTSGDKGGLSVQVKGV